MINGCMPPVVCLSGSAKFGAAWDSAYFDETVAGKIVLSICPKQIRPLTPEEKLLVDGVYMAKIAMADEVLVLNVGGYIGASTKREVWFAHTIGKEVRWLDRAQAMSFDDVHSLFSTWGEWQDAAQAAAAS